MKLSKALQPWQTLTCRELFVADPWVKLSVSQVRLPSGQIIDDFYQVKLLDYAGIVAQTPDGRIIFERQYKHGVGYVNLVLPGGAIEIGEDPLVAAQRELLEETGYTATHWQFLGSFVGDANQIGSKAHLYKAWNIEKVSEPNSGDLEDMEIVLLTPDEVIQAIYTGEIAVLGTAAAVALALNPAFDRQVHDQETEG